MTKKKFRELLFNFLHYILFNDKYSLIFIYYLDDILHLCYFNCEFYTYFIRDIFSLSLFELALFGVLFNCNLLRKYKN